jgi:hypothetical protein
MQIVSATHAKVDVAQLAHSGRLEAPLPGAQTHTVPVESSVHRSVPEQPAFVTGLHDDPASAPTVKGTQDPFDGGGDGTLQSSVGHVAPTAAHVPLQQAPLQQSPSTAQVAPGAMHAPQVPVALRHASVEVQQSVCAVHGWEVGAQHAPVVAEHERAPQQVPAVHVVPTVPHATQDP